MMRRVAAECVLLDRGYTQFEGLSRCFAELRDAREHDELLNSSCSNFSGRRAELCRAFVRIAHTTGVPPLDLWASFVCRSISTAAGSPSTKRAVNNSNFALIHLRGIGRSPVRKRTNFTEDKDLRNL